MKKYPLLRFACAALVLIATRVSGADEAADVMAKVDANLTKVRDQTYDATLNVIRDGKIIKSMAFTAKLKGLKMKLVKFTAPGDVRGMAVLTTENGNMYVYLPSYQRVRRIAAHVRNQGFMGTDFSPDDIGGSALTIGWKANVVNQDEKQWILDLLPTPDNDSMYKRLRVTVLKKTEGVSRIEYFGSDNKHVKTQVRKNWKSFGPITVPTHFRVVDERTGSQTIMEFKDCRVNTGLTDRVFTKRALMRAR